jgi:hypothetical protein
MTRKLGRGGGSPNSVLDGLELHVAKASVSSLVREMATADGVKNSASQAPALPFHSTNRVWNGGGVSRRGFLAGGTATGLTLPIGVRPSAAQDDELNRIKRQVSFVLQESTDGLLQKWEKRKLRMALIGIDLDRREETGLAGGIERLGHALGFEIEFSHRNFSGVYDILMYFLNDSQIDEALDTSTVRRFLTNTPEEYAKERAFARNQLRGGALYVYRTVAGDMGSALFILRREVLLNALEARVTGARTAMQVFGSYKFGGNYYVSVSNMPPPEFVRETGRLPVFDSYLAVETYGNLTGVERRLDSAIKVLAKRVYDKINQDKK